MCVYIYICMGLPGLHGVQSWFLEASKHGLCWTGEGLGSGLKDSGSGFRGSGLRQGLKFGMQGIERRLEQPIFVHGAQAKTAVDAVRNS